MERLYGLIVIEIIYLKDIIIIGFVLFKKYFDIINSENDSLNYNFLNYYSFNS